MGQLAAAFRASRPLPPVDGFSVGRSGQSGQLLTAILVLTAFEAPAVHLILHTRVSWPVQLVVAVLHIYGVAWLVGDLRLIREAQHRLGEAALSLQLGQRWRAKIPYTTIARVEMGSPPRRPDVLRMTPLDSPNVLLCLRGAVEVVGAFGIKKKAARIALYLDDPAAFTSALQRRLG